MKKTSDCRIGGDFALYVSGKPTEDMLARAKDESNRCVELMGEGTRNTAVKFSDELSRMYGDHRGKHATVPVNNILWILMTSLSDGDRMEAYRNLACDVGGLFRKVGRRNAEGEGLTSVPVGRTVIEVLRKPGERMTGSRLGGYNMLQSLLAVLCFGMRGREETASKEAGAIVCRTHMWAGCCLADAEWCCRYLYGETADGMQRNTSLFATAPITSHLMLLSAMVPAIGRESGEFGSRRLNLRGALREILVHLEASASWDASESMLAASLMSDKSPWRI